MELNGVWFRDNECTHVLSESTPLFTGYSSIHHGHSSIHSDVHVIQCTIRLILVHDVM